MTKQQRPERAAPPVGSKDFYEKPNPYWIQQAEIRKRARPEVNSWEWRDTLQKKAASAQARKRARLDKKNK